MIPKKDVVGKYIYKLKYYKLYFLIDLFSKWISYAFVELYFFYKLNSQKFYGHWVFF